VVAVLGVPDLGKRRLRAGLGGPGQRVEHGGNLVEPAALFSGLGEHVAQRGPEPERTVTDREHRSAHPAALAAAEQIGPGLGGLALTVIERDQLLGAIRADTDDDQQAHLVLGEPDLEVDPVGPHIHLVRPGQGSLVERLGLGLPLRRQPGDRRSGEPLRRAKELLQRRSEVL
jgi:hypothetical protein